jgi:hypothetical protein
MKDLQKYHTPVPPIKITEKQYILYVSIAFFTAMKIGAISQYDSGG